MIKVSQVFYKPQKRKPIHSTPPTFIKKAENSLPIHRIVQKDGSLLTKYIPNQKELLQNEGVILGDNKVTYSDYAWHQTEFHQTDIFH